MASLRLAKSVAVTTILFSIWFTWPTFTRLPFAYLGALSMTSCYSLLAFAREVSKSEGRSAEG
jgi:hypothetical protein